MARPARPTPSQQCFSTSARVQRICVSFTGAAQHILRPVADLIRRTLAGRKRIICERAGTDETMSDPEESPNRRGAIAGLLIAVAMLAVGLWLARDLTAASKMQDCLMS